MEDQGNIKVVCRFRPMNEKELQRSENLCVNFISEQTVSINDKHEGIEPLKFTLDKVFSPTSQQVEVYEVAAKPIVEAVMQGFNGTVFAYGQTSSGKTFTMTGPDFEDSELMGIIPRMVKTVFDGIESADDHIEFSVKVSYCEIYLEKIKDLLDTSRTNLKVHEDRTRGIYIDGLSERYVSQDADVYELMRIGTDNREVAYTNMNAGSSRSHSIFLITIGQNNSKDYSGKVGKLYLVDLAGSEKVGKTGAAGKRLEEAKNINKSLTALGQVINSLTDGKSTHVPYRDSKLTRVLQDSLGGNSKTSLIVTCSPSPYNAAETVSSLRFGIRAKSIKNKPKINREYTIAELKILLTKSQEEIEKRDRVIAKLEESLKSYGGILPDMSFSLKLGEEGEKFNFDELISEVEELKIRLSEEVDNNAVMNENNKSIKAMLSDLQNERKNMLENLEQAQQNAKNSENVIKDQENLIQKLVITKENLEMNLDKAMEQKLLTDILINEKDVEINQYKQAESMNSSSPAKRTSDLLQSTIIQLQQAKENNVNLQKKINELEIQIDNLLNTEGTTIKNQQQYIENLMRREREKWQDEKEGYLRDLSNRINKVIQVEIELDNLRDSYRSLENTLSDGSKVLRRKNIALEQNLEEFMGRVQKLTMQNNKLIADVQFFEKKINEESEKYKNLETIHSFCQGAEREYEAKIRVLENELYLMNSSRERTSLSGNIKKVIRGGPAYRQSTIFQRISDI